jgi:gluconokinase
MSLGGALHSLLALNNAGRPLTGIVTWADGRAADMARPLTGTAAGRDIYCRTGCVPHGMYPLYKIMWLRRHDAPVFRAASRFVSAKEYVTAKLIGEYVVDYSLASGSGLLDVHNRTWNPAALNMAGITPSRLSGLAGPRRVFNGISAELASAMGIPRTTLFVLGSSDAANSSIGAGAVFPWQATCMLGTSGALRVVSPRPVLDEQARSWCYAVDETHWIAGGAVNNGGIALSWLRDLFGAACTQLKPDRTLSFDDLVALAEKADAGSGGIVCLPLFAGERSPNWNVDARGAFFGLSLRHGPEHLARAVLEGVAFRLRSVQDVLGSVSDEVRQVRASGGFTRSPFWLRIVCTILNRQLMVPPWGETSCLGAAMWALVGTGHLDGIEDAASLVAPGSSYEPDTEEAGTYEEIYHLYRDLYEAVCPLFERVVNVAGSKG